MRPSGHRGRDPCQSHHPAGARGGTSPGRGPGAGGLGSGRRRASDHQPWLLSRRGNRGSERGSHLPKVTQQGDVGGGWPSELILQFQKMLNHPLPRTEGVYPAGVPAPKGTPEAATSRPSRIPEGPSPHCLTRDQPVTVLPGCPGSQPEPLRRLEERQELNKPRDAGLETSPCFSWAQSLLFIAVGAGGGFCQCLLSQEYSEVMNQSLRIR